MDGSVKEKFAKQFSAVFFKKLEYFEQVNESYYVSVGILGHVKNHGNVFDVWGIASSHSYVRK